MAQPPRSVSAPKAPFVRKLAVNDTPLFGKTNLTLMIAGAIIIILGMILMAGGRSTDPKVFNYNEVYSKTRITVAPILIIIGILVEVVAIFKQPRSVASTDKEAGSL